MKVSGGVVVAVVLPGWLGNDVPRSHCFGCFNLHKSPLIQTINSRFFIVVVLFFNIPVLQHVVKCGACPVLSEWLRLVLLTL